MFKAKGVRMKHQISLAVFLIVVVGILSGCGMKGRFYAVDRPRTDQAQMGNSGYIGGEKKDGEKPEVKSTRRIYVFEFNKRKAPEATAQPDNRNVEVTSGSASSPAAAERPPLPLKEVITIPYIGDDELPSSENLEAIGSGMLYTVTKDDTLQKISKKVYGAFGKWTKIYDANKDKIKNPNFVKPGTVLVIPPLE